MLVVHIRGENERGTKNFNSRSNQRAMNVELHRGNDPNGEFSNSIVHFFEIPDCRKMRGRVSGRYDSFTANLTLHL